MIFLLASILLILIILGVILNNCPEDDLEKEIKEDIRLAKSQPIFDSPSYTSSNFNIPFALLKDILPTENNKEVIVIRFSKSTGTTSIEIQTTALVWEEYSNDTHKPTGKIEQYIETIHQGYTLKYDPVNNTYYKLVWWGSEDYLYWTYTSNLKTLISSDLAKRGIYDKP